jgi:hypothetical protein
LRLVEKYRLGAIGGFGERCRLALTFPVLPPVTPPAPVQRDRFGILPINHKLL